MSNTQNKRTKNSDQVYSFYWNYNDQVGINRKRRDKNACKTRRNGVYQAKPNAPR